MNGTGTIGVETFRVHPEPDGRLFAIVIIEDTLAKMRARMIEETGSCHVDQIGCCVAVSPTTDAHAGIFAVVYLSRERLGSGLVAHELTHCAFRAAEAIGLRVAHWERTDDQPDVATTEEMFALMLERLTAEFWSNAYAIGVVV